MNKPIEKAITGFKLKTIAECIADIQVKKIIGNTQVKISSIEYDSRKVKKSSEVYGLDTSCVDLYGTAFFALPGIHVDGKKFIDSAIKNGAVCIFYEGDFADFKKDICYIQVENIRSVMSKVSSAFYDRPFESLAVIGVTGTEGKSSTVSFIFQLLNLCGKKAGFFSTVEYSLGGEPLPNPEHQTTPESNIVQKQLAQMRDNNCEYAVVESSSHGLSPLTARLQDVNFDAGIFINVTQEHLEFHKTLEQYRYDKANLFRALDKQNKKNYPVFGIVNYEDKNADYFINATKQPVYIFSTDKNQQRTIKEKGGFFADKIEETSSGIKFKIYNFQNEIPF